MRTLLLGAALAAASPALATADDLRTVAAMQSHDRVLLVFAPRLDDPRLAAQRREFARHALAASERDLVLVQVAGAQVIGAHDPAEKLRRRFGVAPADYRTVLLGKDGHAALAIVGPISSAHLMGAIDAMPMRQDELRRAHEGRGVKQN